MGKYIIPAFSTDEITIIDVGYESDARKPPIGPKPRYHYILYVVLSGKVMFQTSPQEEPTIISGGQLYAVYPQDPILFKPLMAEPLEQFFIGFEAKDDEIIRYVGLTKNNPTRYFSNTKAVSNAFHRLINNWTRTNKDKFHFLLNFYKLLTLLNARKIVDNPNSNFTDIFSMAINYMEENLHKNMTLNELTEHLKIDRSYFSKIFKKQFGTSPYQYYLRLKFLKAQTMLLSTNYTISQISEQLGFSDVSSFSQVFARIFHKRPTQMRKHLQSKHSKQSLENKTNAPTQQKDKP